MPDLLWVFAVTSTIGGQPVTNEFLMTEKNCKQAILDVMHDLRAAAINDTTVSCTPQTPTNPPRGGRDGVERVETQKNPTAQ
jgi:hypothetical protein